MSPYRRYFDETKYMSFLMKDHQLLEKDNEIWGKVSNSIKQGFDSEHAYNEKYLKTKTKPYEGIINTIVHHDKIPKEASQCYFPSVMLVGSVYRTGQNDHPQLSLEECKYVVKQIKMPRYITDNKDFFDEENSDESNYNEEI